MLGDIYEAPRQLILNNADVNTANALLGILQSAPLLNTEHSEDLVAPVVIGISSRAAGANWARDVILTLTEKKPDGSVVKSTTVTIPQSNVGVVRVVRVTPEFQASPGNVIEITVSQTANAAGATAYLAVAYVFSREVLPRVRQVFGTEEF